MAKILLAFFNGIMNADSPQAMPCFYEAFIQGLRENGNDLLVYHHDRFNASFSILPDDIRKEIETFAPDCAILFNNCFYDLSEYDFPIVVYEVDSILYYSNQERLKANPDRFRYVVCQEESRANIKSFLGVQDKFICQLPFFTAVKSEPLEKKTNISFIGTRFAPDNSTHTLWNDFMMSSPSEDAIAHYREALSQIALHPYWTQEEIDSRFYQYGINTARFLPSERIVGALSGVRRIQVLSAVADLGLDIYGTPSWVNSPCEEPLIPLSYNKKSVYSIQHNQDVYNSSKLSININHLQAVEGFSWRVCDIMASSSCLVSEYKSDLVRLFPKVPIPTFSNQYEAREQCCRLLKEDALREDIVCASNEAIEGNYRFNHLIPMLEDFLGIRLTSSIAPDKSQLTIRRLTSSPIGKIWQETSGTSFRLRKVLILLSSMLLFSRPERRMYRERKLAKLKRKYHIQ
ncbi:MAG: glycosyltransferase family 1 protein [Mailhella sp.]|nr:glycosyltransferase family 1 protein [Mailhella sp.]